MYELCQMKPYVRERETIVMSIFSNRCVEITTIQSTVFTCDEREVIDNLREDTKGLDKRIAQLIDVLVLQLLK